MYVCQFSDRFAVCFETKSKHNQSGGWQSHGVSDDCDKIVHAILIEKAFTEYLNAIFHRT